jgi:nucleoside-diphosphate-sugar epimerase
MHIIITGGRGYIGRALVDRALGDGHSVALLGARDPVAGTCAIRWRLGDPVPAEAWQKPVDVVIHLAHAWHTNDGPESEDINVRGAEILLQAARAAGVKRFVFVSSLSARGDARNRYGRVKYRIEGMLLPSDEVSARVGLVYGGTGQSLWATLRRLAAFPLLPMVARRRMVQPIHISDTATGLLALATATAVPGKAVIAVEPPIEFGAFLREAARRIHGHSIAMVDVPERPLLWLLDIFIAIGVPLNPLRERVLGLLGLGVQPASADNARLKLTPLTVQQGLDREAGPLIGIQLREAAALLRYVLGTPPAPATLRRFMRGWRRYQYGMPVLPSLLRRCPRLLRLSEPRPGDCRPRAVALRARLAIAAVLADTEAASASHLYAYRADGRLTAWTRFLTTGMVEALLLLPRSLVGLWMWR